MKFSKEDFKNHVSNLYATQDSKYFIITAFKLTLIPIISFGMVFYSLWTIMEMNFNFFVANGFASGELFKEAFYDKIFMEVSNFIPYFLMIIVGVFFTGLLISWLVLRSFDFIENFAIDSLEENDQDFEVVGLNKNKIINQVSRIFFKYLQICEKENKRPRFRLPKKLDNLSRPPFDKVFFIQYSLIVSIVCLITNITLFTFTNELYQQIVSGGIDLLEGNKVVTNFLSSEKTILSNIYALAITVNIILYLLISKNIVKSVDGVSFGFCRDMLRIIKGDHTARLRPRYTDPGKGLANSVNDYLDHVFPEEDEEYDDYTINEAVDSTYSAIENYENQEEEEEEEIVAVSMKKPTPRQQPVKRVPQFDTISEATPEPVSEVPEETIESYEDTEFEEKVVSINENEPQVDEDLPPAFVQEKQVANGEKVFHITTPEGLKVENVDAEMLLKIVKETKK